MIALIASIGLASAFASSTFGQRSMEEHEAELRRLIGLAVASKPPADAAYRRLKQRRTHVRRDNYRAADEAQMDAWGRVARYRRAVVEQTGQWPDTRTTTQR